MAEPRGRAFSPRRLLCGAGEAAGAPGPRCSRRSEGAEAGSQLPQSKKAREAGGGEPGRGGAGGTAVGRWRDSRRCHLPSGTREPGPAQLHVWSPRPMALRRVFCPSVCACRPASRLCQRAGLCALPSSRRPRPALSPQATWTTTAPRWRRRCPSTCSPARAPAPAPRLAPPRAPAPASRPPRRTAPCPPCPSGPAGPHPGPWGSRLHRVGIVFRLGGLPWAWSSRGERAGCLPGQMGEACAGRGALQARPAWKQDQTWPSSLSWAWPVPGQKGAALAARRCSARGPSACVAGGEKQASALKLQPALQGWRACLSIS